MLSSSSTRRGPVAITDPATFQSQPDAIEFLNYAPAPKALSGSFQSQPDAIEFLNIDQPQSGGET
jgi:hypothetical protein